MSCHPVLPLVLTAASHAFSSYSAIDETDATGQKQQQNYCSELILWRVDPIGKTDCPNVCDTLMSLILVMSSG